MILKDLKNILFAVISLIFIPFLDAFIEKLLFDNDMGKYILVLIIGFCIVNTIAFVLCSVLFIYIKRLCKQYRYALIVLIYLLLSSVITHYMSSTIRLMFSLYLAYVLCGILYLGINYFLKISKDNEGFK